IFLEKEVNKMNERFWKILSRVLIVILGSSIGYYVLPLLWDMVNINISFFYQPLFNIVLGAIILFLIYGLTQPLLMRFIRNIERDMRQLSIEKVLVSAVGVIIGLVLAWLI